MNAYKVEATLTQDGTFVLEGLPFRSGEDVEIIVLQKTHESWHSKKTDEEYPLQGTVIRYEDPFEPAVSPAEWDALQ
ncbi:MAG: hypothetical protein AAGN15_16900 [Cyanobacteria bacterium J06581_3]